MEVIYFCLFFFGMFAKSLTRTKRLGFLYLLPYMHNFSEEKNEPRDAM